LLEFKSPYTNAAATRICENNGSVANFKFALKVYLKNCPYRVLLLFFSLGIMGFGTAILMFEYTVDKSELREFN
jgi:hypothetical protein